MFRSNEIVFEEEGHKYYLADDPKFKFKFSGSKIAKIVFGDTFDAELISNKLCSGNPKYLGWNPQNLRDHWNHAAIMGTVVHQEIENYLLDMGSLIEPKARILQNFLDDLMADENLELFPELVIFNKEKSFSGMVDLVVLDKTTNKIRIYDWKTNKKMTMAPWKSSDCADWNGIKIPNCKFDHYSLQLSAYRYILEENFGVETEEVNIVHLEEKIKFKNINKSTHTYEHRYEVNIIPCRDYRQVVAEILSQ